MESCAVWADSEMQKNHKLFVSLPEPGSFIFTVEMMFMMHTLVPTAFVSSALIFNIPIPYKPT